MRKIEKIYENPIDNILISLIENTQHIFHNIGFNPNGITTLSIILSIYASIEILNKNFKYAGILFLLSYFFDCMDGNMARTYNQVTTFGDYYDHIGDIIKTTLVLWALYSVDNNKFKKTIPIVILVFALSFIHLSCQETLYNANNTKISNTLNILNYICPANSTNVSEYLKVTKYFGCGTANMCLVLLIMFYDKL